jgi:fatty-acyl-CoA synthase
MARSYNLADLIEILAAAGPDRPALVAGAERRTYRQLNERASRVGHHLADAGVRPGEHVAILSYNRAEWIEAMLGAFKIRAVPIPVNYRYVAAELRHVLADSDSVALIGERSLLAKVAEIRADLPALRHVVALEDGSSADAETIPGTVEYEKALAAADPGDDFPERSSDDRYIMYTGGTTGYPKGVEWRCEDIFFGALGGGNVLGDPIGSPEELAANADQPGMAVLDCAPVMHGAGQWVAYMGLFSGAKVVLYTDHAFDADKALRLVAEEQANVLMLVGDVMARPVAKALAGGGHDTSSLIAVASGGAPLTEGAKRALQEHLPNIMFLDNYGASETGACGPSVDAKEGTARFMMKPGITVLDDDLNVVKPGEIGRLARSGHIPLGYYNDPEKTASTFFTDAEGTRWSVPGDFASLEEDGTITLLGRGSLMINTGGEKVYPEEVEVALKDHPDVDDAVVVGLPDERFGQRVAAVVAARPGTTVTLEQLTEHCRGRLAGYKLPRQITLVDEVQRTAVGKSDYKWARAVLG